MVIKKYLFRILILLFFKGMVFGMDASVAALSPIDKVFLNACKKNTDIGFALEKGAKTQSVDPENGYTGMHYACMNNNLDRIKWFLKYDWNLLNVLSKDGSSPINVAVQYKHAAIAQYLIDTQFIYACKNFSGPFFQTAATNLLRQGANVNAKADDILESSDVMKDFTPLLYACIDGETEKAKFLLSHGADVNQKSAIGLFPLYIIFSSLAGGKNESKRWELTKLLLEHGADLSLIGPGHHSILAAAVRSNSIRCIKLLLSKGIDVNVIDKSGHSALHEALSDDLNDLVPILFNAGVKPIINVEGISLVHVAAIRNNAPILKELIARGLDVNLVDNYGQTPLHYASEQAGVEVIQTLLDAGATINSVDKNGKTPLMLAKNNPFKESLPYLQKESRKLTGAQKNVHVIDQGVSSQKKVTEKAIGEQRGNAPTKKNPKKKKKKKKEPAVLLKKDEASPAESAAILPEIEPEPVVQPEVAPIETEPAPIEQSAGQVEAPQVSKIKKQKKSLMEHVQQKAVDVLITPKTKKSFAEAVGTQQNKEIQKQKEEKIAYGDLEVALPIGQRRLMLTGNQENPLAKITKYSEHVEEKRNDPSDYFHNFSPNVEKELGYLAQRKVLQGATKEDSDKIQYTIPATVSFIGGNNVFPGAFEFVVQNNEMLHRFFKPATKIDKKKMQLMLPASTGNISGAKFPK